MPTKQEIIDMMENHLPGEPINIGRSEQPPAYPSLEPSALQMQQEDTFPENEFRGSVYSITQAPIAHPPAQFGARSHLAYCPSCRSQMLTRVDYEATMMTHIIAAILCCTTCSCCLPYLFDNCKSARHYCPQCESYLGSQVK
ncbi:uncharacterized protein LOC106088015 [Stomoxys calcitrans]|uniref:LITAF domain-containing protein n=1 Tax=Stomoxys calcitrans TaxID=35570 RepID=A0A1I8Q0V6_STOCA|nr:uncharacterized protein LOC106088015 [Stomoxys calcitrans]